MRFWPIREVIAVITRHPARANRAVTTTYQFCIHKSIHFRYILFFFSKGKKGAPEIAEVPLPFCQFLSTIHQFNYWFSHPRVLGRRHIGAPDLKGIFLLCVFLMVRMGASICFVEDSDPRIFIHHKLVLSLRSWVYNRDFPPNQNHSQKTSSLSSMTPKKQTIAHNGALSKDKANSTTEGTIPTPAVKQQYIAEDAGSSSSQGAAVSTRHHHCMRTRSFRCSLT